MEFEWNDHKARANQKKHRVSFEEAQTVFGDPLARIFDDEWHSLGEHRELIVGCAKTGKLLVVSFTEPIADMVRIISAREATPVEQKEYESSQS